MRGRRDTPQGAKDRDRSLGRIDEQQTCLRPVSGLLSFQYNSLASEQFSEKHQDAWAACFQLAHPLHL